MNWRPGVSNRPIVDWTFTVEDILPHCVRQADADEFNLADAATPGSLEVVVDLLPPELHRRSSDRTR
jgi:hypothetical protein